MNPSVRKGEPWGEPAAGPADVELTGRDADLAALVSADGPGSRLVRFRPAADSDLGRAIGLGGGGVGAAPGATSVPVDALRVEADGREAFAVNAVVLGPAPDRLSWRARAVPMIVTVDDRLWHDGPATTVVVASGQHLRGHDLVPRGHPGDGWAEVQAYALRRSERIAMRKRLPAGADVPHPRIRQGRARRIEVRSPAGRLPLEVDGVALEPVAGLRITVLPGALRLLV